MWPLQRQPWFSLYKRSKRNPWHLTVGRWLRRQLFTYRVLCKQRSASSSRLRSAVYSSAPVPVPLTFVGFRTLLTFDSPLAGIKYSWALYTNAVARNATTRPRNPQEISKVLLLWPDPRNTFERYASNGIQRRMRQRSLRYWTLVLSSRNSNFRVLLCIRAVAY